MTNIEIAKKIYGWAYYNMEGCDEPEFSFFDGLCFVAAKYLTEKINMQYKKEIDTSKYDENIEF